MVIISKNVFKEMSTKIVTDLIIFKKNIFFKGGEISPNRPIAERDSCRVAERFIFKPKIPILVKFGGP
jgi:hypothetical protein